MVLELSHDLFRVGNVIKLWDGWRSHCYIITGSDIIEGASGSTRFLTSNVQVERVETRVLLDIEELLQHTEPVWSLATAPQFFTPVEINGQWYVITAVQITAPAIAHSAEQFAEITHLELMRAYWKDEPVATP